MRCPACTQRNSVAARNCKFCGAKFKKAPQIPFRAIGGIVVVGLVIAASSTVGSMIFGGKPVPKLKPIAERMAAGPKNPEDAQLMRVELDNAVVGYLEQNGNLSSPDLLTKLQSEVPSSAFEVLVFDLPNKIKLVELACVLQPSDYLVVPSKQGNPKVTRISGLSVFDGARVVDSKPDPCLVLLGHSTGEHKLEPQFRAVALMPSGETIDKTDKLFPPMKGSGSAKFIDGTDDIEINRSVVSSAKDENLFDKSVNFTDEPFKTTLRFKNGTYEPSVSLGSSEIGALYAVASSLVDPSAADIYRQQLSSEVRDSIKKMEDNPVLAPGSFKITKVTKSAPRRSRRSRRSSGDGGGANYILATGKRGFEVSLVKAGRWSVTTIKETAAPLPSETVATEPVEETTQAIAEKPIEPIVEVTPEPTPEPKVVERLPEKKTVKVATISGTEEAEPKASKKRDRKSEQAESESRSKKEPKQTETASSSTRGTPSEIVRKVTMRTGPARQNESITNLAPGAAVRILEERNSWVKIAANGREGWVYGSYVKRGSRKSSSVANKPEVSEPVPSKREKKRDRERERKVASESKKSKPPAPTKTASTKTTKTASATTSSVDKSKKSGKYKSQISSSKAHAAPKEAVDEPDFVP